MKARDWMSVAIPLGTLPLAFGVGIFLAETERRAEARVEVTTNGQCTWLAGYGWQRCEDQGVVCYVARPSGGDGGVAQWCERIGAPK